MQHLRRLEPRIMFDGAAVATIDVAATGADEGQEASAPDLPLANSTSNDQANAQTDDFLAVGALAHFVPTPDIDQILNMHKILVRY